MWNWLECAKDLADRGETFVIATITQVKGSAPREVGAKMILTAKGEFFGTVGGGLLEQSVQEDAQAVLREALNAKNPYPLCFRTGQCCGGAVDVFFEIVGLQPVLYLFGAGHVGQAVCQVLQGTPFRICLIDQRPEWLNHPQTPQEVVRISADPIAFIAQTTWSSEQSYVAIMTHDHALDEAIVAHLGEKSLRYLGLIGSETKWARMRRRLGEQGLRDEFLNRVECPLGLFVAGKAPQEVAISLAGRLLKLHYG